MALKEYETAVQLDTLYEVTKKGGVSGLGNTINPYISVNSGSIDIYAITSATQPTTLSEMTLADADTGVVATRDIATVVRYIAFKQNAGTSTEIIVSGLELTNLGAIA